MRTIWQTISERKKTILKKKVRLGNVVAFMNAYADSPVINICNYLFEH